ncbi:motile sperm domain-containing protein 1-like [Neolamprologus brichardi]|uniref:Motile sperm domain-containing protein 1-like n=1 Tax=Neolamprologus brichardi TaxID=32507 RepID=A0A3Q4I4Y9_NEOBR|nr:motile sperm domain-containing protein 1-like [Neolamprologus brichardi]XP_006809492.2 motile sperm domain-containing protein 1-like [Neolamprologus brichardi]XP_035772146.1 motile sperm domain-containing protein 1-like [Neolamprologus brichardi]XP_035772147.1 motile sperm domain-containing protein 1-like [Neolamprologus brichardi]
MRRRQSHDGRGDEGGSAVAGEQSVAVGGVPRLAVFLFPSEMVFYAEQRSSHRRVLTLYNPYSFSLSFKMWCTAPSFYRVVEAEGNIRAKSCVDLVVRHLDVSPRNWGRRDRFRMEVRGGGQVGRREIWAELRGGQEEEEQRGGQQRAPPRPTSQLLPTQAHLPACTAVRSASQWAVCVAVAVLCVTVLMLPLHTDSNSLVPRWLHVSTNQKLVCAYTLGLVTMVFLR